MENIDPIKTTIERAGHLGMNDLAHVLQLLNERAKYCEACKTGLCPPETAIEYIRYLNNRIKKILVL